MEGILVNYEYCTGCHSCEVACKKHLGLPAGEFAVGSVYHLPLEDNTVQLLVNVFSPLATEEFARVLMPGGYFLYVVPSSQHLWELKQVLYDHPYENPVKTEDYPGFVHRETLLSVW